MAVFKGGRKRDDTFIGGTEADRFMFDPRDLTSGDVIVGGAGRAIDVLRFRAPGAISAASLANVSQIERIELSDGANSLVLTDAFVSTAEGGRVKVIGGAGDDLIYAAALTGTNAIDFVSSGGVDYVFTGAGADTFTFDIATLDGDDRVSAGSGSNTLRLSGTGTVTAAHLSGMTGIGTIALGNGGVSLALTDALVVGTANGRVSVIGGSANDVIDASAVSDVNANLITTLELIGGVGDDLIIGGYATQRLPDTFSLFTQTIDGGTGADTIRAGRRAQVVYDPDDISVTSIRGRLLVRGAVTIDLTRTDDQSSGDRNVVTGFASATAAEARAGVTMAGSIGHTLIGSARADVLTGASAIEGGGGADTLIGGAESSQFTLRAGDFARGEVIQGNGDRDTLVVLGTQDIRQGSVTGIDIVSFDDFPVRGGSLIVKASQLASLTTIVGGEWGRIEVAMERDVELLWGREPFSYIPMIIDVTGTSGGDIIRAPGIRDVHAGNGNDIIRAGGVIYGERGDDRIESSVTGSSSDDGRRLDGGPGNDTLAPIQYYGDGPTFDLSRTDNQLSYASSWVRHAVVTGFENIDLSEMTQTAGVIVKGSDDDNILTGRTGSVLYGMGGNDRLVGLGESSSLDGGSGDDVIVSGGVRNTMTGGSGADTFVWNARNGGSGRIFDFETVDRLAFEGDAFRVSGGGMDKRLESRTGTVDLSGVDLFEYTGGALNTPSDVLDLLNSASGTAGMEGIFVVGVNSSGSTVLFHHHFSVISYPELIVELGTYAPLAIQLDTLMLI